MKQIIKHIIFSLVFTLLLTAPAAQAELILIEEGEISTINNQFVNINDTQFRLSPTVKVLLLNKQIGTLRDIQKGDYVRISVFKFNKRKLVDTIDILNGPEPE